MTIRDRAFLYQINVSSGGVPKRPVEHAHISIDGVAGDTQKNRAIHGGKDRALCLYSLERIQALRDEGHSIDAGSAGENFTISGLNWSVLKPGDHLRIGKTLYIEITSYTDPCRHNAQWFLHQDYRRISQTVHPGWSRVYAKVLEEGMVYRGDSVSLEVQTSMETHV